MLTDLVEIKRPGIYAITHISSGKKYIGSAHNLRNRQCAHITALRSGVGNIKLQRAVNKYGIENFTFNVILICDKKNCLFYEESAIREFNAVDDGFNVRKIPSSNIGIKLPVSEETKRKIGMANAIALRGNTIRLGTTQSLQAREKMSNTKRKNGKKYSFNGKEMCLSDWAEQNQITTRALQNRISRGWPLSRALTEPSRGY